MATQLAPANDEPKSGSIVRAIDNTQLDGAAPRAMFMPANMGEAMELAKLMANSNFVPPHLRAKPGDCLAVVMQAGRWAMDPFSVGNKSYFVNDRIAYEAQLVNAVINSAGVLDGRLHPEWEGEGNELVCTVTGKIKGDDQPKKRRVAIKNITTRNSPLWKQDPEQQLAYYASRAWVRLHAPEVLMGVYTPDELDSAMSTAGAADGIREIKPLTAAMLEHQGQDTPEGEGPADEQRGEPEETMAQKMAGGLIDRALSAELEIDVRTIRSDFERHRPALEAEGLADEVEEAVADAEARVAAAE